MPPKSVGVRDAKTHFSCLLSRVARGESFTIARHGVPVGRLVPAAPMLRAADPAMLLARFEAFAERHPIGRGDLKKMRAEGRR